MIASIRPELTSPLSNDQIARRLDELADELEADNENPFRVGAYRTAADVVRGLRHPVRTILDHEGVEGLTKLRGIGRALARVIEQLARTGELPLLDELRGRREPARLLATVPGVGHELAQRIHEKLGISTFEELETAAHDGRLAEVPGVGPKRLRGIREALAGRFRRRHPPSERPAHGAPPVSELLEVDAEYRRRAEEGTLPRLAPRRFNPKGEAWLPMLRTRKGGRRYRALYSNTAQAHRLNRTRDWVVIYCDEDGRRRQWTVTTAKAGPFKGRRVVRDREEECASHYASERAPSRGAE
jgi:hypothetical protein